MSRYSAGQGRQGGKLRWLTPSPSATDVRTITVTTSFHPHSLFRRSRCRLWRWRWRLRRKGTITHALVLEESFFLPVLFVAILLIFAVIDYRTQTQVYIVAKHQN